MRRAPVLLSVLAGGLLGTAVSLAGPVGAAVPRVAAKPSDKIENVSISRRVGERTDVNGKFKGDFRFRGEGGYISFDLHSLGPGIRSQVRAPMLGGAPVVIGGKSLVAHLKRGVPADE